MKNLRRTYGQVINWTTGKTSIQFTTLNSEVLRKKKHSKKMSNNDRPWHWPHPTQLPTPLYTHKTLQVDSQGNTEKTLWQAWTRDCNQLGYPIYQKSLPPLSGFLLSIRKHSNCWDINTSRTKQWRKENNQLQHLLFFWLIRAGNTATGKAHSIQLPYGQSEPAPMTAPVGCSVHRMGVLFSSCPWLSGNQHSTTVNVF
jgi:hypothetical protein